MYQFDAHVTVLQAPDDNTTQAYLDYVQSAESSIHICIFGFHLPRLTDTLVAKHQAGLDVSLLLDHSQAAGRAETSEVQKLVAGGVPLLIGTSPVHHQILHTKRTVIDGKRVESGSWNYSLSASMQANDMYFIEHEGYAQACVDAHNALIRWIRLHEMTLQPHDAIAAQPITFPLPAAPAATALSASRIVETLQRQPSLALHLHSRMLFGGI